MTDSTCAVTDVLLAAHSERNVVRQTHLADYTMAFLPSETSDICHNSFP